MTTQSFVSLMGEESMYGMINLRTYKDYINRYKDILSKYNIESVLCGATIHSMRSIISLLQTVNQNEQKNVLYVLPRFTDCRYLDKKSFQIEGNNFIAHSFSNTTFLGTNVEGLELKELRHNETLIGHYIKYSEQKFAIFLYINPFPFKPRATPLKVILKYIQKQCSLSKNTNKIEINKKSDEELLKINIDRFKSINNSKKIQILKDISLNNKNVETYQRYIMTELKKITEKTKEIEFLEETNEKFDSVFIKNFLEIRELNTNVIKSYKFTEDYLHVDFGEIEINYKNNTYIIGKFIAHIYPDTIRFFNVDNKVNKEKRYDHPHIVGNSPCFGNFTTEIYRMLANLEFKKLLFSLAQYLRTYSEQGGPYLKISYWPKVKSVLNDIVVNEVKKI